MVYRQHVPVMLSHEYQMLMPELLSLCVHSYTAMSGHVIYPQDDQQLSDELTCT